MLPSFCFLASLGRRRRRSGGKKQSEGQFMVGSDFEFRLSVDNKSGTDQLEQTDLAEFQTAQLHSLPCALAAHSCLLPSIPRYRQDTWSEGTTNVRQ